MSDTKEEFKIFTAIDILDEQCVRLEKGDYNESTVYNTDPLFMAKFWEGHGAKNLHIIDLDGARDGRKANYDIIEKITQETKLPIQVGGGIRTIDSMEKYFSRGVDRVILGSIAVKEPEIVKEALDSFGSDRIVISLDCRGDFVSTEGWLEDSDLKAIDIIAKYKSFGLNHIIYTDIERDGMLTGPNIEFIERLLKLVKINVSIAGGVANIKDVRDVKALYKAGLPVEGVVIGKAIYEHKISPKELYVDDL